MEFYIDTYETDFMIQAQQLLSIPAPKKRSIQDDDSDSENYVFQKNYSQSVPKVFQLLGYFQNIDNAEEALYQLIGRLIIAPGAKTIKVMNGIEEKFSMSCVAVDGLKTNRTRAAGGQVILEVIITLTEVA